MSHIVRFSVQGLAGSKTQVAHELNRHLNVFFGLNGSGKTSLLRILHSAMLKDSTMLSQVPFESAMVTVHSEQFQQVYSYRLDKAEGVAGEQAKPRRRVSPMADTALLEDGYWLDVTKAKPTIEMPPWSEDPSLADSPGWQHEYLPTSRLYEGIRPTRSLSGRSSAPSEDELAEWFSDTMQYLWGRYFSRILVEVREAQQAGLTRILEAVLSDSSHESGLLEGDTLEQAYDRVRSFLARSNYEHIIGSRKGFEERYQRDPRFRSVVSDIDSVEKQIGQATKPRTDLQSVVTELFTGNKTVTLGDSVIEVVASSGADIGLGSLSSGEKHVIRILVDTLRAGASSIIIDEPELSMHIDWQRKLISLMRELNPQAQIIMATHSPEVMAEVPDENIFRL